MEKDNGATVDQAALTSEDCAYLVRCEETVPQFLQRCYEQVLRGNALGSQEARIALRLLGIRAHVEAV